MLNATAAPAPILNNEYAMVKNFKLLENLQ